MIEVKVGAYQVQVGNLDAAAGVCRVGRTACVRMLGRMLCAATPGGGAMPLARGSQALRVTFGKRTSCFPSPVESVEVVTIDYADEAATVDLSDGRRVQRRTLYVLYPPRADAVSLNP